MNHEKPIEEANNQTTIMETHLNPSEGVPTAAPKYHSITLTTAEILDLAIAANLIPKALRTIEEELETEYTIFERSGGVLVYDDDKTPHIYGHGAYITEYPDEGTFALGAEIQSPTQSTPQPVEPAASGTPESDAFLLEFPVLEFPKKAIGKIRDLEQRLRSSLTQTAAIQAQWDAAMGDLKTLEAERAQYREAIKVATDALERCCNSWVFYVNSPNAPIASIASMDGAIENAIAALAHSSELTPKV